jgi:rhamnosyltransferase
MQQTVRDVEIILVDSSSAAATVAVARQYPIEVVTPRPNAISFGPALKLGLAAVVGVILSLLVVFLRDALRGDPDSASARLR